MDQTGKEPTPPPTPSNSSEPTSFGTLKPKIVPGPTPPFMQTQTPRSEATPSPFKPAPTHTPTETPWITPSPEPETHWSTPSPTPTETITPTPTPEPTSPNYAPTPEPTSPPEISNVNIAPVDKSEFTNPVPGLGPLENAYPIPEPTSTPTTPAPGEIHVQGMDEPLLDVANKLPQPPAENNIPGEYHLGDTVVLDRDKQAEIARIRSEVEAAKTAAQPQTPVGTPHPFPPVDSTTTPMGEPGNMEAASGLPPAQPTTEQPRRGVVATIKGWFGR